MAHRLRRFLDAGGGSGFKEGLYRAILIAFGTMVFGTLIVPLATLLDNCAGVLIALFIIASGVALLEVAANPLAASIGAPERSHFRLLLTRCLNSLGTVVGPLPGASILLSGGVFASESAGGADREASLRTTGARADRRLQIGQRQEPLVIGPRKPFGGDATVAASARDVNLVSSRHIGATIQNLKGHGNSPRRAAERLSLDL